MAIVGESACGKSVSALSIMRLIPYPPGLIVGGEIIFHGKDILKASEAEMRHIRGNHIAMIFQEPTTSLNPVLTVQRQLSETLELHRGLDRKAAGEESLKLLQLVGIIAVMLVLTFYYPILLKVFGDPDIGPIATGYLGLFLLSCASLAIGIFASSLTSNQIVAAVVTGGILFGLWFLGSAADYLPSALGDVIGYFSLSNYFPDFITGIIDTRGIVYYLSVTALFLFLAIRSLENSRWS